MLELEGVEKSYLYGAKALEDISFTIKTGERISLLGGIGSGKTTLVKTIAGILIPEKGRILLDGRDITELPSKFRGVRAVYDKEGFFKRRSLAYNIEYPLKIRKFPKKDRKIAALKAAEEFGFAAFTDDYVFRQDAETLVRAALSRVTLYGARLNLYDNPFSQLTGAERKLVFLELLPKLPDSETSMFLTDSPEEAFQFSEKAYFLHDGKIVDFGSPEHFEREPESLFSDKYLNLERNFSEFETSDGVINFYGRKIAVDAASKLVTASFTLSEQDGEKFFGTLEYGWFGRCFYRSREGLNAGFSLGMAAPDFDSLRIYDSVSGNPLAFAFKSIDF